MIPGFLDNRTFGPRSSDIVASRIAARQGRRFESIRAIWSRSRNRSGLRIIVVSPRVPDSPRLY